MRIKLPTLGRTPWMAALVRWNSTHLHVKALPHSQYLGVWVFPSSILKEPKSRDMANPQRKRTDWKFTKVF